jgi:tRNA(fMet)-specific endonuclease VapC
LFGGGAGEETDELKDRVRAYVILPYDEARAWEWARVMTIKGHPMGAGEAWIAAAALRHDLPLVTHNPGHFRHIAGLRIITEAE